MIDVPKWLENAIFYEIYPQSFQDSNGDGIGDINGITSRLNYICELGCNAIWINPCFDSPFTDGGYDVRDYYKVAPRYGSNEDLRVLFREAHRRGMHVILDLVPGHTSYDHPWFQKSMQSEENEFSYRYVWTDSIWHAPTDIAGLCGFLRGISDRDGCCGTNYYSTQPALNYGFANIDKPWQNSVDSPSAIATREELKNVMRFWLKMGCDGFRVDMAASLVKNDPDSSETIKLWQNFRQFLDEEFPLAAIISEWGDPAKALKGGFHMDFLLQFGPSHYNDLFRCEEPYFSRRGKGDVSMFVNKYKEYKKNIDNNGYMCLPTGNHDMKRLRHYLDNEEMKIAFAFILSMPGVPFIYYGDEIGMKYLDKIKSVEGGYERTGSRSPMQWDSSTNAGFSSGRPEDLYIMIDPDNTRPTAESSIKNISSLYNETKRLISLRLKHQALQSDADIDFIYASENKYPLIYKRIGKDEEILIAINPSDTTVSVDLSSVFKNCDTDAFSAIYFCGEKAYFKGSSISIPPSSATYFLL